MNIFKVVELLEQSSGVNVEARVISNELEIIFCKFDRRLKCAFSSEEVNQNNHPEYWTGIGKRYGERFK